MTGDQRRRRSPHLIVCGDNSLAYRIVQKLVEALGDEVTVILESKRRNYGPRITSVPHVRVIEAPQLSEDAFRAAGVTQAGSVALVSQDDVGNIHAALLAQELNSDLRLVIRFFDVNRRADIQKLFPECAVLSDADTAAPFFAVGALSELPPSYVQLKDRTLYVRRRNEAADRVICGLAKDSESEQPTLLPTDQHETDLVLAEGHTSRRHNWLRTWWQRFTALFNAKLVIATLGLFALLGLGTVLFARVGGFSLPDALYFTILDAAGAAEPNTELSTFNKIIQVMITFVGISIVPAVTATVVEAVVNSRLTAAGLGKPRRITDHVVVVGLGNVGTRVVAQLQTMGVDVVCVDSDANARGVPLARQSRTPIVIGDASLAETLKDARVHTCRALVAVTSNDATNLTAALQGRETRQKLRVVLRLVDNDLAKRVEREFDIAISQSVPDLAAPTFVAAMLRLDVLQTIPVGQHRVLLIAEVPIQAGSSLDGGAVRNVNEPGEVSVIAVTPHATGTLTLPALPGDPLASDDKLIIVATRAGLGKVLIRSGATQRRDGASA
ncbi:MAG: NAD-binding protein [Pseudonocardiaceae bacterium]